ncbi:type II toxin-antitoxin system RelE/ParE family toxin [Gemmiger formicilis]|uniref:type II toxin-antitoxin system RelE/ParE family toxin n=1 Tax=Gemmiger formicilis TaxID=745368 RepID=UPI0039916F74
MKYNIHVTQAAERDMANAYDYIDLVLKNPTAADKLLDVADEKIGALAEFPHKFEVVSDKLLSLWGIRFTIVMNYLAFYTVDDATQTVHIVRFLYSMRHTLYYTQRNAGKFIIVETKAPTGYFGDWTDINHPGMANTPLGKRGYYIEITEDSDNSVIWLDNADYNADIAATDKGGTKLVTRTGVETTVTIYDTAKDPSRTYNTDNSGKAANEDSYTITPTDGVMKNDRTLGEISISKVDLDAVRYVGGSAAHGTALASGQTHGDAALDGAVYDLYAAEDITHPDGVTGVVDYSKIVDADGNPIWHTTIRDNSGQWVSDYLPVLKKDHLVASAKIENGWLCFSNLYLGKYYVVERSTGVVIPLRDGALVVSSTYPTVDSRTKAATGQAAALAKNGSGQYTDWVYKNQFSTVSKGKALDGSWTYDAYYLSFADGYLVDEHNYYITPAYSDEGWYVEKTTFADNRQAAGEQIDKTSYSANYHIHADNALAESQDQAAKGNVEISKIVSSSGQSNGLELEGAGFTLACRWQKRLSKLMEA